MSHSCAGDKGRNYCRNDSARLFGRSGRADQQTSTPNCRQADQQGHHREENTPRCSPPVLEAFKPAAGRSDKRRTQKDTAAAALKRLRPFMGNLENREMLCRRRATVSRLSRFATEGGCERISEGQQVTAGSPQAALRRKVAAIAPSRQLSFAAQICLLGHRSVCGRSVLTLSEVGLQRGHRAERCHSFCLCTVRISDAALRARNLLAA